MPQGGKRPKGAAVATGRPRGKAVKLHVKIVSALVGILTVAVLGTGAQASGLSGADTVATASASTATPAQMNEIGWP